MNALRQIVIQLSALILAGVVPLGLVSPIVVAQAPHGTPFVIEPKRPIQIPVGDAVIVAFIAIDPTVHATCIFLFVRPDRSNLILAETHLVRVGDDRYRYSIGVYKQINWPDTVNLQAVASGVPADNPGGCDDPQVLLAPRDDKTAKFVVGQIVEVSLSITLP